MYGDFDCEFRFASHEWSCSKNDDGLQEAREALRLAGDRLDGAVTSLAKQAARTHQTHLNAAQVRLLFSQCLSQVHYGDRTPSLLWKDPSEYDSS